MNKNKHFKRIFRKKIKFPIRRLASFLRKDPNFIIIGTQRGGTTSLYNYLLKHPQIKSAFKKEVHFFDNNYHKGLSWYKAFFPLKRFNNKEEENKVLTGEATPNYLFHPYAAERVHTHYPDVKIIILLRNPVKRAYSHYRMNLRNGFEDLSFEDSIKKALEEYKPDKKRIIKAINNGKEIAYFPKYSYLARGEYIQQIKRWFNYFSKEQLLVLESEKLFTQSSEIVNQVFSFLNLGYHQIEEFKKYQYGKNPKMSREIREWLVDYYREYNNELERYLDRKFNWD